MEVFKIQWNCNGERGEFAYDVEKYYYEKSKGFVRVMKLGDIISSIDSKTRVRKSPVLTEEIPIGNVVRIYIEEAS